MPIVGDSLKRTIWFGTVHGDMIVRYAILELIIDDIKAWLAEARARRPVSDGQVARKFLGVKKR